MKKVLAQHTNEEISFGKMVELINEEVQSVNANDQKILDTLRFASRNLNRLEDETSRAISTRVRRSMNFRIRKLIKSVDEALNEFAVCPECGSQVMFVKGFQICKRFGCNWHKEKINHG